MNILYKISAIMAALVLFTSGCGYSMSSSLDERFQTIHVSAFKNESREFDLQAPLTNAVIRKFLNDGRLRVVGPNQADLVLEGTVIDYDLRGLTFDLNDDPTQFEMSIIARVQVTDARTGEILWQDSDMFGDTSFATAIVGPSSRQLRGNTQVFLPTVRSFQTDNENFAAAEALERLATDIFFRTIEPW